MLAAQGLRALRSSHAKIASSAACAREYTCWAWRCLWRWSFARRSSRIGASWRKHDGGHCASDAAMVPALSALRRPWGHQPASRQFSRGVARSWTLVGGLAPASLGRKAVSVGSSAWHSELLPPGAVRAPLSTRPRAANIVGRPVVKGMRARPCCRSAGGDAMTNRRRDACNCRPAEKATRPHAEAPRLRDAARAKTDAMAMPRDVGAGEGLA